MTGFKTIDKIYTFFLPVVKVSDFFVDIKEKMLASISFLSTFIFQMAAASVQIDLDPPLPGVYEYI